MHHHEVARAERVIEPVGVAKATGKFAQPVADAILDERQALLGPRLVALTQLGDFLILAQMPDRPLRIWIAGCSTGEETYSLAMLFREQITASNRNVKLQFFASDVDPDAIASAREGRYPETIEADVSPARLARFFSKEDHTYTVMPELRASVVFTVHDVLADPPFSRLDLVSCRNLLIYLGPEAQAKVMSRFHFALREGGGCEPRRRETHLRASRESGARAGGRVR